MMQLHKKTPGPKIQSLNQIDMQIEYILFWGQKLGDRCGKFKNSAP